MLNGRTKYIKGIYYILWMERPKGRHLQNINREELIKSHTFNGLFIRKIPDNQLIRIPLYFIVNVIDIYLFFFFF